jgi:hypothetical protein
MLGLLVFEKWRSIDIYPFVVFPKFCRFFSLAFGGFSKQDDVRGSAMLGRGTYAVAIITVLILIFIVVRCSYKLKIGFKRNNIFVVVSTLCRLLVIGTHKLMP